LYIIGKGFSFEGLIFTASKLFKGNFKDVTEMEISYYVNNIKTLALTPSLELSLQKKKRFKIF
jgi:hypothetical protein